MTIKEPVTFEQLWRLMYKALDTQEQVLSSMLPQTEDSTDRPGATLDTKGAIEDLQSPAIG